MATTTYDPRWNMARARAHYFEVNGFGVDGGYSDAWVDFKVGPIPFPFPNTQSRKQALQFHDLHHIVTGYDTNFVGELQISAWEIGAGCGDFVTAWFLNLSGLAAGALVAPVQTWRAFQRGRSSQSLYLQPDADSFLQRTVEETRHVLGTDREPRAAGARDVAAFTGYALAGAACAALFTVGGLALLPLGLAARALAPKRPAAA
jgi:hypothetical protein